MNLLSIISVISSMTVQEWIVSLIVLLCVIEVGRRFFRFFRVAKSGDNPCDNCVGGCDFKRALDEKQRKCKEEMKKKGKNCCG